MDNDDTYTEKFIIMNMDKIIERIRTLMKEQFVYKRSHLIERIKVRKDYPLMQINEALSHLIDDKNEFITDMFGRLGNLVNIGEYYMFQPIELENTQMPYYERIHPIPYKRSDIKVRVLRKQKSQPRQNIINRLREYYECVNATSKCNHLEYSKSYEAIILLSTPPFSIDRNLLQQFMYNHIFDSLSFSSKLEVLTILWSDASPRDLFEANLKQLIMKDFVLEIITGNAKQPNQLIIPVIDKLPNKEIKKKILILKTKWQLATKQDLVDLGHMYDMAIEDKYKKDDLNKIVGFMGSTKAAGFKFKIADIENKSRRNKKGFQCITQQKQKILHLLNTFMEEGPVTNWHDIKFLDKEGGAGKNNIIIKRGFSRHQLCNIEELILRYYNHVDSEKTWFFSSFGTKINKIEGEKE